VRLGCHDFPAERLLVMVVINRTPDSFYDKGRRYSLSNALRAVDAAVVDGADVVDIGVVKATPGPEIAACQVIERVVPLITVAKESILIDPGHDFAKNTRHSLEVTRRIGEIVAVGQPVLVAVSNKDFIGESLGLPVTERLEGTLAVISLCAWMGVRIFRVHNVREARRAIDMVSVVMGKKQPLLAKRATS
jgi:dihydropteroate synthase